MPESDKRRRRPAVSCTLCRKRKIRCNKESPCSNCIRSKSPHSTCVYDNSNSISTRRQLVSSPLHTKAQQLILAPKSGSVDSATDKNSGTPVPHNPRSIASHAHPIFPNEDFITQSAAPSTGAITPNQQSAHSMNKIKARILQLEEEISQSERTSRIDSSINSNRGRVDPDNISESAGEICKSLASISEFSSEIFGEARFTSRYIMHKRRLFGQSYWGNCLVLFRDLFDIFEGQDSLETASSISNDIQKCKEYARIIKSQRAAIWPSLPTPDVPPRGVCDKLIDCYFRTSESVYRVVHIPTFMKDYTVFWESSTEPKMSMVVTLKLIMAIGATVYDRNFSLRSTATRWVHQAEAWLCRPDYKARVNICTIQCQVLLTFAREAVGLAWSQTWLSIGDLLRTAIYMGLHRDPSKMPRRTCLASELRRRIWNTLLEIVVRTSLNAGGPPLLSLDDFDTFPPENFNDNQLMDESPQPKPDDEFTDSSISRVMRTTLPARLAIVKYLNSLGGGSAYDRTLQLEKDLRTGQKAIRQITQSWRSRGKSQSLLPSSFQLCQLDMVWHRFLLALHVPWFGLSLHDPACAYTRRVAIESSIALWRITNESSGPPRDASYIDFVTMSAYRTGFLHAGIIQACHIQLAEISAQLREHEDDILAAPISSDLLPALEGASEWAFRVLQDGETNIKGYLVMVLLTSQIKGAMSGATADEIPHILANAMIEAKDRSLSLLEGEALRARTERILSETPPAVSADSCVEDWDLAISDTDFSTTPGFDPINWVFEDSILQTPQFCPTS